MKENNYPDFSEKCLSIRIKSQETSFDICYPEFKMQAGKLFLEGVVPHGNCESNWNTDKVSGVLWDEVRSYIIFDSREDIEKAIKISEDFQSEDEKNT